MNKVFIFIICGDPLSDDEINDGESITMDSSILTDYVYKSHMSSWVAIRLSLGINLIINTTSQEISTHIKTKLAQAKNRGIINYDELYVIQSAESIEVII